MVFGQSIEKIRESKPFEVSGSLGGNVGYYTVDGIDQRTPSFRYGLSARLTFKIYGFAIPLYAAIRDHSLNYGGSFSRFRINPQYKWVKLYLGDTYVNMNPYTLSGRTINGYGVELTPGNFRFKFLKGKIEDLRSYTDTLSLGTAYEPTYSRKVTAVGIGFGNSRNYFDLYGIVSKDRLDSLNGEKIHEEFNRKSNTVLGGSFALRLAKRIQIRSNAGLSFQTENLDSYGTNTLVGENPVSENLAEANISSNIAYAGDVSLNYSHNLFSLNGKVKYIQPYYQPLTVAYVNTDLINYTVGGSFSLFKRRLNLVGSVGIQQNNLTGAKLSTANNLIANFAANFRISNAFSGNFNYSNFTQDFTARMVQINDLYTYAITNNLATLGLNYKTKIQESMLIIGIRGGRNSFLTVDDSEVELTAYDSWNTALNVGLKQAESSTGINSSFTYRKYNRSSGELANYGVRLNATKSFMEDELRLVLNTSFHFNDRDGLREGNTWRNGLTGSYKLNKKSNISLNINHLRRVSNISSDFTEIRLTTQYLYRF